MDTATPTWNIAAAMPASQTENWYALLTRARHERTVEHALAERGIASFVPTMSEIRRWSDRRKIVEFPLFSCYVFAKLLPTNEDRLKALRIESVFGFVGNRGQGTPIPEEQIDAVRKLLEERVTWHSHPFLKIGQRVCIRSGALDGVEGILVSRNGEATLVISVDAIQRSLAIRVEGYDVEAV